MKIINYLLVVLFGLTITQTVAAQSDTIRIEGKNQKRVVVLNQGEETKIVLKDDSSKITIEMENDRIRSKDSGETISWSFPDGKVKIKDKKNYSINFLSDFAFGYAPSEGAINNFLFDPYRLPSTQDGFNFSMNIVKQEVNLYRHKLFLTTAFGINNYYHKLQDNRLMPMETILPANAIGSRHVFVSDSLRSYSTNRLDSRFYSIPITLKWNLEPTSKHGKFAVSGGVELNFNNRIYSKRKIDEKKEKLEARTQLNQSLSGIIPSLIIKMQYGSLGVFGRFLPNGIYPGSSMSDSYYSFGLATQF